MSAARYATVRVYDTNRKVLVKAGEDADDVIGRAKTGVLAARYGRGSVLYTCNQDGRTMDGSTTYWRGTVTGPVVGNSAPVRGEMTWRTDREDRANNVSAVVAAGGSAPVEDDE